MSPALWLPYRKAADQDPSSVGFFYDDFENFSRHISAQNTQRYSSYIDNSTTIKQSAVLSTTNLDWGVIEVAANSSDNDEASITTGGNTGVLANITAGGPYGVIFEARLKKAAITADSSAFFIGLSEEGLAAADTLVDNTGALASKDFVGFQVLHDSGAGVDAVWRKAGQAVTNPTNGTDIATMVADTYIKLGFIFQPWASADQQLSFYVNGAEAKVYGTAANLSAATFPSGEEMALLFATKVGSPAESKLQLDWWACAQLFE
jgi:hypothetical protein